MALFDFLKQNRDFKIIGEKCYLSPLGKKNLPQIREWFNDKELIRYAFGVEAEDKILFRIADKYLKGIFSSSTEIFGIWNFENQLMGFVNYSERKYRKQIARIGILLGKESFRSGGIGTDALKSTLLYLFDRKGIELVDLDTAQFNKRAHQCFFKCGFEIVRKARELDFLANVETDKYFMELKREDFIKNLYRYFNKLPTFRGIFPPGSIGELEEKSYEPGN